MARLFSIRAITVSRRACAGVQVEAHGYGGAHLRYGRSSAHDTTCENCFPYQRLPAHGKAVHSLGLGRSVSMALQGGASTRSDGRLQNNKGLPRGSAEATLWKMTLN